MANLLAAHPTVFTPEHEQHHGQHESAFFCSVIPYCRKGRGETDRRAVRAIFERSDFWHLLFQKDPPKLDIETLGLYDYFAAAMGEAAIQHGCSIWLEKTPAHTVFLRDLIEAYPNARFIAVQREAVDAVRSSVYRTTRSELLRKWIQAAIWGEIYRKILAIYRDNLKIIFYENLRSDFSATRDELLKYVGLSTECLGHDNFWAPNSTFSQKGVPPVSRSHRVVVRLVQVVFRVIPARWCEQAARIWMQRRRPLPPWFFRVFKGGAK